MNKADIMEHVMSETGTLYGLKKSTVEHILKEYEIALLNGLELDGEVPLLNFGKLVLEIKKVRTLKSKFIKEGSKELPERAVIKLHPGKLIKSLVAGRDFEGMRARVKTRKRPKI